MKGALQLLFVEVRIFLREPMAAFFNLVFPISIVFLFGVQFGGPRLIGPTGVQRIDALVPATVALVIATTGVMSITMQVAVNRERGVLRRLAATPLRPAAVLIAMGGSFLAITMVGMGGVILSGAILGASFPSRPLVFVGAVLLSCAAMFGLGFLLASVIPNARVAQAVAPAVFFPMLFLSGMSVPREFQTGVLRAIAEWLPATHVVQLLGHGWHGQPVALVKPTVALLCVAVVAAAAGLRLFRWSNP